MKKISVLLLAVFAATFLAAELVVDIPFELDIVGESYAEVGEYQYISEWIEISNSGSETQQYTIEYSNQEVPAGWLLGICDEATCFMPNFAVPLTLEAGQTKLVHIDLQVASTGGFAFPLTFAAGDLDEPITFNFTFNTADNLNSAETDLTLQTKLSNYPNPFNPSKAGRAAGTTISFASSAQIENASIEIFNSRGQKIASLPAPNDNVVWPAKDAASGIYFYRLIGDNFSSKLQKMSLLK
ncbi:MAG: T9SS type A sorting domain-containing protein [Candidatus Cloacimonadales bacterium]